MKNLRREGRLQVWIDVRGKMSSFVAYHKGHDTLEGNGDKISL